MKRPLVSVLMTAYNREKYIGDAIESVLNSSFSDFEFIIVDDCSCDSTFEIIKRFASMDPRIRALKNERNLGDYPNRMKAALYAKGKYLKYVDSDDLVYSHGIETFVLAMEKFPEAALGISSPEVQLNDPYPFLLHPQQTFRFNFFKRAILDGGPSGVIIKRDIFNTVGGFSGKNFIGDNELWLKIACHYPVVVTASSLIYWREHEGQQFKEGNASGLYPKLYLEVLKEIFLCADNERFSTKEKNKVFGDAFKDYQRHQVKQFLKSGKVVKAVKWMFAKPYKFQ